MARVQVRWIVLSGLACACSGPTLGAGGADPAMRLASVPSPVVVDAYAVDAALATIAATTIWPGFEPLRTPLAIYDGRNTVLFRHPAPPPDYLSLSSRAGVYARPGRDSLVTANSSVTLAGVPTATLLLDPARGHSAGEWAAIAIHELFHVFQRARHPSWSANEVDYFTYPFDDTLALARRREETIALHRALAATRPDRMRCWVRIALDARRARFARLGPAAAEYERRNELNEGLARYVERRALRRPIVLDAIDPPVERVRQRSYEVGAALARLLDDLQPGWRQALEGADSASGRTLDGLLGEASGSTSASAFPPSGQCSLDAGRAELLRGARREIVALDAERRRARATLLDQPGLTLVVMSDAHPLFPQGFDPLNVRRLVPSTDVLHSRFARFGNERGSIELLGRSSLSEGRADMHPLFGGIVRVTVPGLASPTIVRQSARTVRVEAPGMRGEFGAAVVDTIGRMIRVRLP